MKKLKLEIRSPEKIIFSGNVLSATLQAVDGQIGILPDHAPLSTIISPGAVRFRQESGEEIGIDTGAGFLVVKNNSASVLVK